MQQNEGPLSLTTAQPVRDAPRLELAHVAPQRPVNELSIATNQSENQAKVPKRALGRRSSKPLMEKRRRARINQCLDILKSYVLTDSNILEQLGIDTMASENQDEETIARKILKNSGLIHRHRGRKNPNKLEKADILELTVDYVRRLHEQRDHWMTKSKLAYLSAQQQHQQQQSAAGLIPTNISNSLGINRGSPVVVLFYHTNATGENLVGHFGIQCNGTG